MPEGLAVTGRLDLLEQHRPDRGGALRDDVVRLVWVHGGLRMLVRGRLGTHQPATLWAGLVRLPDADPAAGDRHDARDLVVRTGDMSAPRPAPLIWRLAEIVVRLNAI